MLATEVWKAEEEPIGSRAFSLPNKRTSASHPLAICTGYCTHLTHKYRCNRTYRSAIPSIIQHNGESDQDDDDGAAEKTPRSAGTG